MSAQKSYFAFTDHSTVISNEIDLLCHWFLFLLALGCHFLLIIFDVVVDWHNGLFHQRTESMSLVFRFSILLKFCSVAVELKLKLKLFI